MDGIKAALIKLKDGRYQSILTKYLSRIKKNKATFKIKGSKSYIECEIIGYNDDKNLFTQIAKNLNSNSPQVAIALDESLNSNILSTSSSSFSNSKVLKESEFKHPSVLNVSLTCNTSSTSVENSFTETNCQTANEDSIITNRPTLKIIGQSSDSKNVVIFKKESDVNEEKNSLTRTNSQEDSVEFENSTSKNDLVSKISGQTSDPKDDVISQKELDVNKDDESFHHFVVYEKDIIADDQYYVDDNPDNINDNSEAVINNSNEADETVLLLTEQPQSQNNKNNEVISNEREEKRNLRSGKVISNFSKDSVNLTKHIEVDIRTPGKFDKTDTTSQNRISFFLPHNFDNGHSEELNKSVKVPELKLNLNNSAAASLNKPGIPKIQLENTFVSRANDGKREGKKYYCFYCCKFIIDQINRHILTIHKSIEMVNEASIRGGAVLNDTLEYITNFGNYFYNYFIRKEDEEFLVSRKPNSRKKIKPKVLESGEFVWPKPIDGLKMYTDPKTAIPYVIDNDLPSVSAKDYVPCKTCFKILKASLYKRHTCKLQNVAKIKGSKNNLNECKSFIPDIHSDATPLARDRVLKSLRSGPERDLIVSDVTLINFLNQWVNFHAAHIQSASMLSHWARVLATLFIKVKKNKNPQYAVSISKIAEFRDLFDREHIPVINAAIEEMCCVDPVTKLMEKPNNPKDITNAISKMLEFYIPYLGRQKLDKRADEAKRFQEVFKADAKTLNRKARDALVQREKTADDKRLPTTEEIYNFCVYVENKWKIYFNKLKNEFDEDAWKGLVETTGLLILLYNRQRVGQLSRLELIALDKAFKIDDNCTDPRYVNLPQTVKNQLKHFYRVKITNKKGIRNVGIIISHDLMESLNLIKIYRTEAHIPPENIYALPTRSCNVHRGGYINLCDIVRKYSNLSGAENCELLRGTGLRKQIATVMCGKKLDEDSLKQLADFLGHSWEIHKTIYRQEVAFRDLLNLPQMLSSAQGKSFAMEEKQNESFASTKTHSDSDYAPSQDSSQDSMNVSNSNILAVEEDQNSSSSNWFALLKREQKLKQIKNKEERGKKRRHEESAREVSEVPKKIVKRGWSIEEKSIISDYIRKHGLPETISTKFINKLQEKSDLLKARSVLIIRTFITNNYGTKKSKTDLKKSSRKSKYVVSEESNSDED